MTIASIAPKLQDAGIAAIRNQPQLLDVLHACGRSMCLAVIWAMTSVNIVNCTMQADQGHQGTIDDFKGEET